MNRRKFIKAGSLAIAATFLPSQKIFASAGNSKVFEISGDSVKAITLLFSSLGGIKSLVNKEITKATVLVKPNICLPHNDINGTTTSSLFVKSICEYLLAEGVGRLIIADHTLKSAEQFETIDMVKYARSNPKITLLLANEQRHYIPRQIDGEVLKNAEVLKILEKADYFINVPTAKHHQATTVSLSVKNLMGVIWDRQIFHTGLDLHQAIADLAKAIQPNLNIVDASRVLLNRGPVGPGPIEKANKIFASTDMVALDSVVVSKYNFGGKTSTADEIPHLWASFKSGVGEINIDKITIEKLSA